jgi:lipoprotein LprG
MTTTRRRRPIPHPPRFSSHALRPVALVLLPLVLLLTACSGGNDPQSGKSATEVLAAAKKALDDTSGVNLTLSTKELPKGVDGILDAKGVGTHAPAFQGDLKVMVNNLTVEVPVVSVNGEVFAKLPFTTKFAPIDPGDYGAPDPATLMDPQQGLSAWLTATKAVEKGEQTRSGEAVLTTYTGMLPGKAVAKVVPSADATKDFPATYLLDGEGRLQSARVQGPFYGPKGVADYQIAITGYGVQKDITAP